MTNKNQNFKSKKFKEVALQNILESNSIEVNFEYKGFTVYLDLNENKKIEGIEIFNKEKLLKVNYQKIKTFLNESTI